MYRSRLRKRSGGTSTCSPFWRFNSSWLPRSLFAKTSAIATSFTGPCGVGKTWLACALGNQACRENLSVLYVRASRLFAELTLGRGDGRYTRLIRIASTNQPGTNVLASILVCLIGCWIGFLVGMKFASS